MKDVVKLENEVIEMAGAQESKKNPNKPRILTLFKEEETGKTGHLDHHIRQKVVHVIPLGFSPEAEDKVKIAKRVAAESEVEIGTIQNEEGVEECCLVFKANRAGNSPSPLRETCDENPWVAQTVRNLWEGALDPFPALEAWQKITRSLGRAQYGYIVR
jgi:hypothetical protein